MTDPVVELQVRVTYQDNLLADLDEVVRDFATRVEQLERRVKVLQERLDDLPEAAPHDAKPPHY